MRLRVLFALIAIAAGGTQAQVGSRDRYFARYPFDRWRTEPDKTQIRWSARVHPATLSAHQRMMSRIEIALDAREIEKRRGRGELVTLLQIEDAAGKRWRNHKGFDLTRIPTDAKARAVVYYQDVFLLPGEYTVAFAVCDSESGDYSFTRRALRVAPVRGDTLARAWADLPAVEFVRPLELPDYWFQPYIRGRVRVGLDTERPVHVDLIMNMTPTERAMGSVHAFRRNMSVLVPALKVLAGMEVRRGSIDVTLLDLTRRRAWEQTDAHGLDWMKMRMPLADTQPGLIDAQSLAAKAGMASFFRDRVVQLVRGGEGRDELRVVVVLSAPLFLDHQYRLERANLERDPNRKIFYLQYRPLMSIVTQYGSVATANSIPSDNLEQALKPLDARVIQAATPEEFRKALSAMLADIQRM